MSILSRLSRRSFLRGAASAPVAVAMTPLAASAAVALPDVSAAVLLEPARRAITPWRWWIGPYEERFFANFATREEAVEAALYQEYPCIIEACVGTAIVQVFDGGNLEELFEEANEENSDPEEGGPVFDGVTDEDWDDLAKRLNAVALQWVVDRGIDDKTRVCQFAKSRNLEMLPVRVHDGEGA